MGRVADVDYRDVALAAAADVSAVVGEGEGRVEPTSAQVVVADLLEAGRRVRRRRASQREAAE
jgi:hypothetical protein